ncbi:hypothetical protein D9M69_505180 [compost metagenome]
MLESLRDFMELVAASALKFSHFCCITPSPRAALSDSMPSIDSMSRPCLSDPSRRFSCITLASGHWMATLMRMMSGMDSSGTSASGPPIMKMMPTNSRQNGRSDSVEIVAEVTKSRTDSNSRSWLADEPDDCGLCSMRVDSSLRNSIEPRIRSAFLPAMSTRCERTWRALNSNTIANTTPMASDHSVT